MGYLKDLIVVLMVGCSLILSSCGGTTKTSAGLATGGMVGGPDSIMSSSSAGKRMDEVMRACKRKGAELSIDEGATALYNCPASALPNLIKKTNGDECWVSGASYSSQCSDIAKDGANTYVIFGIEDDMESLSIIDCVNKQYYLCSVRNGVL